MPEYLNQLLADAATALVRESFTGVDAEWWWERRLGGGIVVCQELDPAVMSREVSVRTGHDTEEVRRVVEEELGLEEGEPVVLTFEIPGDTTTPEVARMLAERSATPEGLAANLFRKVEEAALDRGDQRLGRVVVNRFVLSLVSSSLWIFAEKLVAEPDEA